MTARLPHRVLGRQLLVGALAVVLVDGCSHKGDGDAAPGGGGTDASAGALVHDGSFGFSFSDATSGTGSGSGGGSTGTGGPPGVSGEYTCLDNQQGACAGKLYKGQSLPTDLFIMFDQSGSMLTKDDGVTKRIDAVRAGVDQFVHAPESAGLGIGIGYFGFQPLMCMCTSCNPTDYATPKVEIGELPGQASAIMTSLNAIEPTGETPTGAAIRGACMYARQRKVNNPMRNIGILLVTDGLPEAPLTSKVGACNPTLDDAVAAATECAMAGVHTYVLGVGPMLDNLNKIAMAGQTKMAHLVEHGGTADIVQALAAIRSDAMIPCQMQVPMAYAGQPVDFMKVNVVYADATCKVTTFSQVPTADKCAGQTGGWYYDNASAPTLINLCGPTCEQVKAAGGQLVVSVGCMTQIIQ